MLASRVIGQRNSLVLRHRMGNQSTTKIITLGSYKRKAYNRLIVCALTLSIISSRALSACPISRIQWWMRPGPRRPLKDNKTIFPKYFYFSDLPIRIRSLSRQLPVPHCVMRILPGQSQIPFRVLIECFPWELERLQRELQHGHLQTSKRVSGIYISSFYEKIILISSEKNPSKIKPFS